MFLNKIDYYVIKKILKFFLLISLVFLSLVNLFEIIELLRRSAGRSHVSFLTILEIIILKTPHNWQSYLVFLFFFGVLMAFWVLNQNQEFIVMQAFGFSLVRFGRSVFITASFIMVCVLLILNPLGCAFRERFLNLESSYFGNAPVFSVSGSSLWLRDHNPVSLFHAKTFHLEKGLFWDVRFFDFSNGYKRYYAAKVARLLPSYMWELEDVVWWKADGTQGRLKHLMRPTNFSIKKIERVQRSPDIIPFLQLRDYQRTLTKYGFSTKRYELYWHSFLAKSILMSAMGFLAIGLCCRPSRYYSQAKLIGVGVMICFILHFMQDLIYALSLTQKISVPLACWGLPLLIAALGLRWLTVLRG